VIIDTTTLITPFNSVEDQQPADIARVWISRNSLRKLAGQLVFVIFVIAPSDPLFQKRNVERNTIRWLKVLKCVFERQEQKIMFFCEDSNAYDSREELTDALQREWNTNITNITYASLWEGVELILEHCAIKCFPGEEHSMGPFLLPVVAPNASEKERFGPWGPEIVMLFGRLGSGKSTLAQKLALGRLDLTQKEFSCSSGLIGETRKVSEVQGRGWRIIDTPGLGEFHDDPNIFVCTDTATELILDHVLLPQGTLFHYFYVWKNLEWERLTALCGRFYFVGVVGRDLFKENTTIVISDADEQ
jgi:hypothetical protein